MEVEAKFRVPDAGRLDRLAAAPRLAGYDLDAPVARRDDDAFLDTADRRFLAAGYYLRRRENADGLRFTLKQIVTADDGLLRREELEQRAAADVAPEQWPPGPLRRRVLEIADGAGVAEFFTLSQERRTRAVRGSRAPVAEMSLDAVTITAGGRDERWFEVEVELVDAGTENDLKTLAAGLRDVWDLAPEPASKFARALAALEGAAAAPEGGAAAQGEDGADARTIVPGGDGADSGADTPPDDVAGAPAPAPWRPGAAEARRKRPATKRDDPMAAAAQKTLRLHFSKMLAHEQGTRLGEDPEELHDMRVATRRMRMALRLFDEHLDPDVMRPVLKGLRRTGRSLGAVRDLDVFLEKTLAYLETLPESRRDELEPLMAAWRREYETRRGAMVAYLDGRRYARFIDYLGDLLAGPPERLAATHVPAPSVGQVLPALLHRDLADVLAAGSLLAGPEASLARFHRLRIAGKALRYTLEFFEAPLGRGAGPLIEATKRLQDHLGDLQDAVVSCGILRDVITWGSWAPPSAAHPTHTDVVLAPGVARYLAWRQEEMERLVATFPAVWPSVAGEEFGGGLARLLARL